LARKKNKIDEPLPDPTGLEHTLSPVDLPPPAKPLPHPLRWTSTVIAVAAALLLALNATALRGWAYQLKPGPLTGPVVAAAESWYDATARFGLNRPVDAMHGWWQSVKAARFGGEEPQNQSTGG